MKLKPDIVRDLLLTLESDLKLDSSMGFTDLMLTESLRKYDMDDVKYTIDKLSEAELIKAQSDYRSVVVEDITYKGHEYLNTVRDGEVWGKTKSAVGKLGGASLAIMGDVAATYAKIKLGLS